MTPLACIFAWVEKVPNDDLTPERGQGSAALSLAALFYPVDSIEWEVCEHLLGLQLREISIEGWGG